MQGSDGETLNLLTSIQHKAAHLNKLAALEANAEQPKLPSPADAEARGQCVHKGKTEGYLGAKVFSTEKRVTNKSLYRPMHFVRCLFCVFCVSFQEG